ncbi:uncharacterized protein LOC142572708 isoform X2 [Dermacentor variabilis]|uniref:uncharacterized protein LOC142572708 isoform X2 n=1 Tax=Dermacentor variabilis TaxID=34621 RepID=UPI003F5C7D21
MKSRSRTTSSHWLAGVKRPTSPSIRSPKTPSNVVVTTPLAPAQVVIQGGWTPSGLAVNVARHHSRSIASSHDSEGSMLMNDARLCASGSRSVEARFSGLPSLPESNKSTEFNGSLSALVTKSTEKASATSTGKSTGSLLWSKSPFIEIQPMVRSSKSATVKRSSVAAASSASAAKAAVLERHSELAAFPADSPVKHRAAFHSSDSVTSLGKRWNVKMEADTARGLLGQTAPEMAISEQYEKLSKKRHASSATSRSSILKTPRTSQASFASPLRQDSQELVSQGSHLTLPLTSPGPHIAEVTIASVEINPIVQARGGFRPSSPKSYPNAHSVYHESALDKLFNEYPMDFAEKHALARARRDASKNSLSVLTQSARGQIAKLKKASKTELSKSGESQQLTTLASQKSSRNAFTKPTLLQPVSDAPSLLTDYQRFKDLKSETITARSLFATGKEPQGIAEFGAVVMERAATSPLAEREVVMKSAITSLSPREAVSKPADTVLRLKADPSSPRSGQGVLGTVKTSTGSQQKPTQVSASVTKSPTGSRPGSPKGALSAYLDAISPPQSPEPWSPRATAGFLDATKSPRPDYRSPSPRSGQGLLGSLNTSTGAQKISTQASASVVTKTPTGSRPGSPKGALSEYLGAILPHYSPELWSPRATVGLLDATKSPRPDARSAPQVSKSPFGSEASAEMAIIKRASPVTDMKPKDGLIRPDIMPASTRDKSPALIAASPSLQVAEASSLRTPQSFSEVAKTTAIAHPESSQVSGSQPGSPVCKPSSLVVASALEPWSPRVASGFLDPTKSTRESLGASPSATQGGQSSVPLSPRATSGVLAPTKSPLRMPGTSPQESQGALSPEPLSPRATSGFLDQTKSARESLGASPSATQGGQSSVPLSPRATSGALVPTKSPLRMAGTSPQASQGALSPQLLSPRATSGFLDQTKSTRESLRATPSATQGAQSSELLSPRATSGVLVPTKSPLRTPGTSPQASQGALSPQVLSPRAASGFLDQTKSPLKRPGTSPQVPQDTLSPEPYWRRAESGFLDSTKSPGTSPQASQGAKSPEPCSPRAASGLLDSTKSPRKSPGTSPQASQGALSPQPLSPRATSGVLDPTKSPLRTPGTSPQASQGALSPEPLSPRAASGFLDQTKSPLKRPGTSPQVPQDTLSPEPYWRRAESGFLDSTKSPGTSPQASQGAKSPEPCSPRAASGLLDSTKSPRKSPGTSPQASQGALSPQPLSPRATSGVLDPTKSPLRTPGTSPQASQGALSPEPLSPRAASGFLDQTKSPLKRPGTSPQVPQDTLSPEPYWRRAESGFLDSTKSPGTSPQASQGAKSPEPCSPRAASGLLDSTKSPRKSPGTSPQASQGALSPQPLSPRATSGVLDPTKSPLRTPGTSPQASQGALSPEPLSPRAASGFLDQTKSTRESLGATPSATQGAQSSVPLSPRGISCSLDQTKSPLKRPGTSPQVPQDALSPEPYWRRAESGFLDSTKSPGTSPQASQGAKSPEPCSPRAASGLLDSTKSPRKSPGTSPQASQDSIYPVADSYSQVKQLEPWSPKATAGTLDSTKSPRLAVQPSPPASKGSLQQTSLQQIQSPQPPVSPLSAIKSPLTPSSQVSASISKLESAQQLVNPSSTIMEIITTEKTAAAPAESRVATERASTEMSAIPTRGSVSTFGLAGHPVTVFAPSPSDTHVPLDTVKSPSQSSIGSPRRALNALGPASPTPTSGLASPSEIKRLLEAKGSPTSFSPLRGSSTVDIPSLAQFPTEPERHDLAKTETTTVRSPGERAGAETSLTQKGSELKVPSGPLVTAHCTDSEQKASAGGSSQLTILSAVEKSLRKESPSGRGLAELDKEKSSVTALTQAAGTGTGFEGYQLSIRASAELLAPSSKSSDERISADQIDARQLEADTSAQIIESTKLGDKRASADIVASAQKKPTDSGVASAEKSAITSPESDAKGSPQKKKGKKGQKGRKVPTASTASTDDDSLSISEHIAQAITESSAQFADIPLQVNMTIDLVPPKSASPMSPARTIMSPVHIEKKMIVESCKDGHVEVKVPPVFIDSPEGKQTSDEALNVSVSVDVGKQATQGHRIPEKECRPAEKP